MTLFKKLPNGSLLVIKDGVKVVLDWTEINNLERLLDLILTENEVDMWLEEQDKDFLGETPEEIMADRGLIESIAKAVINDRSRDSGRMIFSAVMSAVCIK